MTIRFKIQLVALFSGVLMGSACQHTPKALRVSAESCQIGDAQKQARPKIPDTRILQRLIDRCAGKFPAIVKSGVWKIGQIHLRSNLDLVIESEAELKLISDIQAFKLQTPRRNGKAKTRYIAISAENLENVTVRGFGKINGSGPSFWDKDFYSLNIPRPTLPRPAPTLSFSHSKNIRLEGITLYNLAAYAVAFIESEDIVVSNIAIRNDPRSPNTDGIQIRDSRNVLISSVDIRTGDDAIVLKSRNAIIDNVVVRDSYLESDDGAIKFGTGSHKGVQNSRFENITINNSRYGIAIFTIDGGTHKNNVFDDIRITTGGRYGRHYPIFLDVDRREADRDFGTVSDLTFRNINIVTSGASLIAGNSNAKLRNIRLENITVQHAPTLYDLKKSRGKPRGNVNIEAQAMSEDYGKLSADFVIAHAEGIVFDNVQIPGTPAKERAKVMLIESNNVQNLSNTLPLTQLTRAEAERMK